MHLQIFKENFQRGFSPKYFFIAVVYFSLSFIGILHHEIWLDEAHHFLLARDSGSIAELIYNARYDGHPLLWNFMLYALTRFTHDPFYMQLFHILISLSAVIVFLRNAPFTDFFKVPFVFGYFMFYEYNIISRNYSLGVLFLFTSCTLLCSAKKKYTAILVFLLLLSYTHLFSLFCAVSIFIVTVISYRFDSKKKISRLKFRIACTVFVFAVLFILWSIIPPPDHFLHQYDTDPYLSFKRIGKAFSLFFKGMYHFPNFFKYHFWNTNLLVDISKNLSVIPSVICFLIPFILFHNKPLSLLVFYLSSITIALFIFWSPIIAGVRYFGYITLLLITSLWLSKYSPEKNTLFPEKIYLKLKRFNSRFKVSIMYSILFIQFFSSLIVYSLDLSKPFSEGKEVAEYLVEKNYAQDNIVVSHQSSAPPISAYLNKKLFYAEANEFGSFCKWNTHPFVIDKEELISRLKKSNFQKSILVLNDSLFQDFGDSSLPVYSDAQLKIFYLAKFDKGIMKSENYRLYEVRKEVEKN